MPGPWDADAATYFGDDPEAIAKFDKYMTEKQQPYVTQLEESTKDARELWGALNNEATVEDAAREIVESVYANDPDFLAAYAALFTPAEPVVESPPVADAPTNEIPEWAKPLVESHQQKVDRETREAATKDYNDAKAELKAKNPDVTDVDLKLIDPFVYSAGGDMDAALVGYRAWQVEAGITPTPPPVVADPPPVVDGSTTPPLATQYTKYDQVGDAFKAWHSRQGVASDPPPVVG